MNTQKTDMEYNLRLDPCLDKAVKHSAPMATVPRELNDNVMHRLAVSRRRHKLWKMFLAAACVAAVGLVSVALLGKTDAVQTDAGGQLALNETMPQDEFGDARIVAMADDDAAAMEPMTEANVPVQLAVIQPEAATKETTKETTMTERPAVEMPADVRRSEYRHPRPTMADYIEMKATKRTMLTRQLECVTDDGEKSTINIFVFPYDNDREVMRWLCQVAQMFHEQTPNSQLLTLDEGQLLLALNDQSDVCEMWMAEYRRDCVYIYNCNQDNNVFASACFNEYKEQMRM